MPGLERLIFFGTPAFAVPTLDALEAAGRTPLRVVSQPARGAGRGRRSQPPPVAEWAVRHGIELVQPGRIRSPTFLEQTAALAPDVAVVVAFGQIFPGELLAAPRFGCVNLHASLLPRYRGAAPIAMAIAAGDEVSGVSTMLMDQGLDTGAILLQREVAIEPDETAGDLSLRLARIGADLVIDTLQGLECGDLVARPQEEELASYAPRLKKDDGRVDWSWSAQELFHRLRAFTPWPGLVAELRSRPVKLCWGRPLHHRASTLASTAVATEPGSLVAVTEGCLIVRCGDEKCFCVETLQRPGRKAVSAPDFANGERLRVGERFA